MSWDRYLAGTVGEDDKELRGEEDDANQRELLFVSAFLGIRCSATHQTVNVIYITQKSSIRRFSKVRFSDSDLTQLLAGFVLTKLVLRISGS